MLISSNRSVNTIFFKPWVHVITCTHHWRIFTHIAKMSFDIRKTAPHRTIKWEYNGAISVEG